MVRSERDDPIEARHRRVGVPLIAMDQTAVDQGVAVLGHARQHRLKARCGALEVARRIAAIGEIIVQVDIVGRAGERVLERADRVVELAKVLERERAAAERLDRAGSIGGRPRIGAERAERIAPGARQIAELEMRRSEIRLERERELQEAAGLVQQPLGAQRLCERDREVGPRRLALERAAKCSDRRIERGIAGQRGRRCAQRFSVGHGGALSLPRGR